MIDMCPQILLQQHNILNQDYKKNPLLQSKANKFIPQTPNTGHTFTYTAELSQLTCNEKREDVDLKNFKEHYIQFGLWPEMGYFEQKTLKQAANDFMKKKEEYETQIKELKKSNS